MRKFERFLDDILRPSKIEAYWRTRCAYKSVGGRSQSLYEMERAFTIRCREITRCGRALIWQTASDTTRTHVRNMTR